MFIVLITHGKAKGAGLTLYVYCSSSGSVTSKKK